MSNILDEFERRILGVLIEKSLAQPSYYPITVNAITAGCNQKNNRDPVMDLDEGVVADTLEALRNRSLVTRIMPGAGSRVDRYKHEVGQALGWTKREQAIMAELLLRGPQTTGELRTRCSRMVPFENLEAVTNVLSSLSEYDPPLVAPLPRAAGQSAIRYTHLLYPQDEQPANAEPASTTTAPSSPFRPHESSTTQAPTAPEDMQRLRADIEVLKTKLEDLHQEFSGLKGRLDRVEAQVPREDTPE
jgi:uncharacterized protein YceH (UPF0502 family)